MTKFEVEFYETEAGRQPAKEFLLSLDKKMRAKVGSDITRVLFFYYVDRRIILTHGFIKKTQRTPSKEIAFAKKCRTDYCFRRENKGERKI